MAASTGAEIITSDARCGVLVTWMRSAFENGRPETAAVDIFANSPALALSLNAEAESAGRRAVAPASAPRATQASAAKPALRRIVFSLLMIVALPVCRRFQKALAARRPLSPNSRRLPTRRHFHYGFLVPIDYTSARLRWSRVFHHFHPERLRRGQGSSRPPASRPDPGGPCHVARRNRLRYRIDTSHPKDFRTGGTGGSACREILSRLLCKRSMNFANLRSSRSHRAASTLARTPLAQRRVPPIPQSLSLRFPQSSGARHECRSRLGLGCLCSARTLRAASTIVSRPSPRPQEWGRCKQECSRHRIAGSLRTRTHGCCRSFREIA